MSIYEEALEYHSRGRKGKIEVVPTKPVSSQKDLSLAYSPGVAEPCRMIAEKEELIYEYTAKGNLVAVVSNGTAVLGLGNIGAHASKPVMEGKGILFKKLADIDVFDIELNAPDPDEVIRCCIALEPTFGGINLEDIKAPDCFYIEETLREKLNIPVFHDDQHGTAVISAAAFLNALEIVKKDITQVRVVFSGGGAAAIACANLYVNLGVKRENIIMCDSKGVIHKGRKDGMNPYKERYASDTKARTVGEALAGADAFVGVSVKDALTADMIKAMARDPIVFAMANPDPEILPEAVLAVRPDAIMATGRSDYPNQVNNVLGFPYIFRGALDTRSRAINEEMKLAAVKALAELAKQDVPESVSRAYGGEKFTFGRDYLIPKPVDRRALLWVSTAVAKAAMDSGVARIQIDIRKYRDRLEALLGGTYTVMRGIKNRARKAAAGASGAVTLVMPEGEHSKILRAAAVIREEGIAEPILLGDEHRVHKKITELGLDHDLKGVRIIRPSQSEKLDEYVQKFLEKRARKGATAHLARVMMKQNNYYASMMVELGHADGLLGGVSQAYPDTIKPALEVIGTKPGGRVAGIYMLVTKNGVFWMADTTVNIEPDALELADITLMTAQVAKEFGNTEPRVAMLSFSNFGSNRHPAAIKVATAAALVRERAPDLIMDGEMQVDTALVPEISAENFPFNRVPGNANVLIFPDLTSGNIAYKLMQRMGGAEAIGPILVGMNRPVHVLQRGSDVNDIVNMAAICAVEAQRFKESQTHA
ncbi:MAG TPA: NADP-dependent malic enzyme [Bdellovibrionota bacterium]|jgi:malate dehydrogenase (oxaloacetate-decarboxylating)(NADP+)|nr:NADP-dependent malic enzyme [Bdellovibrionota bacterium]